MDGSFPPGVAEKIRQIGPKFDEDVNAATRELFAPLVKQQPSTGIEITADIAYGAHKRQKLDLYRPPGRKLPVVVYLPGGAFIRGDKNQDGVFYVNLGVYFARHGYVTIVANYRLAPECGWPAGAEDAGGAIVWARREIEAFGGDPNRILLIGQSAGASHAASYLFDPRFHGPSGAGVKACVLMSGGGYRVPPNPAPNAIAYYGTDPSTYEDRSAINHASKSKVPLFISVAEFDPGPMAANSFELARVIAIRDGKAPEFAWFRGHNHVSTVQSLGSNLDDVGARIREFLARY